MIKRFLIACFGLTMPSVPAIAAEQQYSITDFDTVRMQGPFRVTIITGKGNSARGEGPRDALDRVSLNVSGGVLTIRAAAPRYGEKAGNVGRADLMITTGIVRRVSLGGNGSLTIHGLKAVRGDINLSGNGDLEVNGIAVDQLVVNSAGGGRLRLAGQAGQARVQVIGAGSIESPGLVAKSLILDSQGPGSVVLSAAATAQLGVQGSGDVRVLGNAVCKINQTGSGLVECGGK